LEAQVFGSRVVAVASAGQLEEAVARCREHPVVGVDCETTGLDPHRDRMRLLQLAVPGTVWVADVWRTGVPPAVAALMADPSVRKVFHHGSFDLKFLRACGVRAVHSVADTMIAAQLLACGLTRRSFALEAVAEEHLGLKLDKSLGVSDWTGALSRDQVLYAARDAAVLLPLWEALSAKLSGLGLEKAAALEFGCLPAVADLEYAGIYLDLSAWRALGEELARERDALRERLSRELVLPGTEDLFGARQPANPNSPQQVRAALEVLGVEVPDTRESTLKAVAGDHPVVRALLECRGLEKLISAFIEKFPQHVNPATGRIHATYDQCRTAAGRFACRDPNVQQVPRDARFRRCFRAPGGKALVICDYSQIELRIAAALSGDREMIGAYRRGEDLHVLTAALVSGKKPQDVSRSERQQAKACFSGDTEVLTPEGWVRFDRYDGTLPVAQYVLPDGLVYNALRVRWDGSGGRIEFVRPLDFRAFPDQPVYRQADRNSDLVLTGDHEVVFIDTNRRPRKLPALEVVSGNARCLVAAGELRVSPELGELETRILAMVVADGSFQGRRIRFGFTKQRKVERCVALLREAGARYRVSRRGRVTAVAVDDAALVDRLLQFVSPEKDLSWRCLTGVDGRVYLEEAAFWDGFFLLRSGKKRVRFSTVRRQTADVMQAMAAVSGIPSVLRVEPPQCKLSCRLGGPPVWRVSWRLEPLPERQTVYCVQVPSGALLVRRNGRVSVQGNCNFGLIYGMSAAGLQAYARDSYGVRMSLEEAEEFRRHFFRAYRGIAAWHRAQRELREVRTRSGRLRRFEGDPPVTELYNTPVQGTGADILKRAMARLRPHLACFDAELVACVHDELVAECPEEKARDLLKVMVREMEAAGREFIPEVPVVAEGAVGKTWADKA
jgi:DNA polymerase-1